ncbi:MAG: DsbA family oxidoreductase [Brevibacterium sp.]|uniref:DsbA family oxidoreductase n=1 Tax=Brevibacterium sandarakinum TaxID=629680 RepID=UPI00265484D7|nr:DsbA family oxidoreductase [Brevibacterium sandarakinum]MDN5586323.1 DsbA family oxidoreductase [Brevibacterium sp.]MDN5658182.1 DsbA family oxidoreductase [Brevibacterium sandarakinum]MDN5876142.1 DsbA family oxidoreductase [Brevibacterium sp.]MDN5909389.1 DsbA family oxidoreductase [Brevibacterium sp.]MDN6158699.1 DsbA family oxidoreductase [Brevibacterium sp.]
MRIEIWSDIACPWCYIGKRRFETALDGFAHKDDIEVEWRSYQLDPSLPDHYAGTETEYLSQAKGMPVEQVRQMFDHVTQQAAGEGLDYDFDSIVVANSFTAHRLLHLANTHGVMSQAKEELLSGHFEKGRNIGDLEYLAEVAQTVGIDADEARRVLSTDEYTTEVESDITEAQSLGANGVPFFVIDRRYAISGAQPPEAFTKALETAWSESQKLTVLGGAGSGADSPASGKGGDETFRDGAVCGPEGCD